MIYESIVGKVAVVTGAASGIGLAVSQRLLDEGAKVCAVDRDLTALNQSFAETSMDRLLPVAADVTDAAACERYVAEVIQHFGRLDLAVHNAGIAGQRARLVDFDIDAFDALIATNLRSVFLGMRASMRAMIDQGGGGAIVNVASIGGLKPHVHSSGYGTAKAGVVMLTKIAALEGGEAGIRVNAVCPGATETPLLLNGFDKKLIAGALRQPIARLADPSEMANQIVYLLSDEARYQTGSVNIVDGGQILM